MTIAPVRPQRLGLGETTLSSLRQTESGDALSGNPAPASQRSDHYTCLHRDMELIVS